VKGKEMSLTKLERVSQRFNNLIKKAREKEVKDLQEILKNVDSSQTNVNAVYKKYLHKLNIANQLKEKIDRLNKIIKKHYEQMLADTEYLKRLELIKPKYFQTLELYNNQLASVNKTIYDNLIDGEDKKYILNVIKEANSHTQNSTDILSKAFLEHYEKYKKLLLKDSAQYNEDIKEFTKDSSQYNEEDQYTKKYYEEYQSAISLLNKLKTTYADTETEAKDFDNIVKVIKLLFKNPKTIKSFYDGEVDGKCATTMIKTHIKNEVL